MKIHNFSKIQIINTTIDKAWDFFSNPANLSKITPPSMNFEITSQLPDKIYPGLIIIYKVSPLPFFRVNWVTEIRQAVEKKYFIDEQRFGPYKFWYHIHLFRPSANGLEMEDIVYYGLPFGYIGNLLGSAIVRRQLNYIFDYREKQIEKLFNQKI